MNGDSSELISLVLYYIIYILDYIELVRRVIKTFCF